MEMVSFPKEYQDTLPVRIFLFQVIHRFLLSLCLHLTVNSFSCIVSQKAITKTQNLNNSNNKIKEDKMRKSVKAMSV